MTESELSGQAKVTADTTAITTESTEDNANDKGESGPEEVTLDVSSKFLFSLHLTALILYFAILFLPGGVQGTSSPPFSSTPIHNGGLGFTTTEIGDTLSLRAIATLLLQLFVFPPLQR
ncbi:MAG: hypothetical protein TREMPRED_001403 [Tremellales sp. Tagirdzhanova-0007]|nr:MAG: hypothetical protein TREMPRED_001403 [Tremellales sp. Tagirdzhanova-0007]